MYILELKILFFNTIINTNTNKNKLIIFPLYNLNLTKVPINKYHLLD